MSFNVGDQIRHRRAGVEREITEVRTTGYSWVYPDDRDRGSFMSENSSDPFFEVGWNRVEEVGRHG